MSNENRSKGPAQDALGLLFFAAGAFLAFSIAMYWVEDGAREEPNPTTAVVVAVVRAFGAFPSFASAILVALLGGLLFFAPRPVSAGRHLAGIGGLLLGTAWILGTVWPGSGGAVGGWFAGWLGNPVLAGVLSLIVGAFVACAAVWFAWIPARSRIPAKLGETMQVSAVLRENDAAGVSSAEAAALLPVNEDSEPIVPAHPIDLRLRGGPRERHRAQSSALHESKASSRSGENQAVVQPSSLGDHADERVGANLVAALPARARPAASRPAARGTEAAARSSAIAGDPSVRILDSTRRGSGDGFVSPPIWELDEADEVEEDPDELAVPELEPALASEWEIPTATKEVSTETEPEFAWPSDDEGTLEHEPRPEQIVEVLEVVAEDEESEETELWEDDDSAVDDEDEDDDDEDEEEDDEEEDDDEEDEEEDADDDDDEEEDDDDDDDEDDEEEDEEDLEEWGSADGRVSQTAVEAVPASAKETTRELPRSAPPEGARRGARRPARELARAPRSTTSARSASDSKRGRATSGSRKKVAAGAAGRSHDDLLLDAGLMIIERGRVAVSMVQREFEMDFRAATSLLDQLQDRGVIGPYLGGRHRDILLSREEWMAIAPASS